MRRRRQARARVRRRTTQLIVGAAVAGIVFAGFNLGVLGGSVAPASAASGSEVTITAERQDHTGSAPFPDLAVTVSQTKDLEQQAIRITWTDGELSSVPLGSTGGRNFLQVFQCWGDVQPGDPGYVAGEPRPDRTTCQYGASGNAGSSRVANRVDASVIAPEDEAYSVPSPNIFTAPATAIPFRSASDGVVVDKIKTSGCPATFPAPAPAKCLDDAVDLDQNPYFTRLTTNEVPWAGSDADGNGSIAFEIQTAAQSPGLGCGSPQIVDGVTVGQSCWLVILPRGTADNGAAEININTSGLLWDSWQHALAIKLEFRPIGSVCPEGTSEKLLQGSELIAGAVHSWQPVVCNQPGGNVYSLVTSNEADALETQATQAAANPPLALTSRALQTSATDPLDYAPVGLTGISIVLAINQVPKSTGDVPPDVTAAVTQPITSMRLTPRLLAKLLTYSYRGSLPANATAPYVAGNPSNLTQDQDFLEVNGNEEFWEYQSLQGVGLADLLIPQGRSDAAWLVWDYIISDPEARDWLAGNPDEYGMTVNPWYSTNPAINPTGSGMTYPRDDFPKADPVEWVHPTDPLQNVNLVTWRPYVNDLEQAGYLTLRGDPQALSSWDPFALPPRYSRVARALPGFQQVLGLSDASVANRYQLVTASLLNPAGQYVAPTDAAIAAASAAMTPTGGTGQVLGFDPDSAQAASAPTAYPLAVPIYAAANRAMPDSVLRLQYAQFIKYAAGEGQAPGLSIGQLPPGYAPLPASWAAQAVAAADRIAVGVQNTQAPTGSNGNPGTQPRTGGVTLSTAPIPQPAPDPTAQGDPVTQLTGPITPEDPAAPIATIAVPASLGAGALAGLAIPFLSRRRPL